MSTQRFIRNGPAVWRYLAAWTAASAVVIAGSAAVLDDGPEHPKQLTLAAERAACRFARDSDRPGAGRIVLSYRPTLPREEIARVRAVARRLAAPAVSAAADTLTTEAVAAENGDERLGCPRVDARAEDAIVLFVLSTELDP